MARDGPRLALAPGSMPSPRHEVLVELFRHRPELITALLALVDPTLVPEILGAVIVPAPAEIAGVHHAQYRADLVLHRMAPGKARPGPCLRPRGTARARRGQGLHLAHARRRHRRARPLSRYPDRAHPGRAHRALGRCAALAQDRWPSRGRARGDRSGEDPAHHRARAGARPARARRALRCRARAHARRRAHCSCRASRLCRARQPSPRALC